MLPPDLAGLVEQYHQALDVFLTGDHEPVAELSSHADDVTLANPFGPPVRGRDQVLDTTRRAAANYRDGGATGFERISEVVSGDLASMVEIERYTSKVGGADDLSPIAVRVTTIFRREDGEWRVVHRHADPTLAARPATAVLQ